MTERYKAFYRDDGSFRGYWEEWHDYPLGMDGHCIDYYSEEWPCCPMCLSPLRMAERPKYWMDISEMDIATDILPYICEECKTVYYGPARERVTQHTDTTTTAQSRNTTSDQSTTASLKKKYRYLIG